MGDLLPKLKITVLTLKALRMFNVDDALLARAAALLERLSRDDAIVYPSAADDVNAVLTSFDTYVKQHLDRSGLMVVGAFVLDALQNELDKLYSLGVRWTWEVKAAWDFRVTLLNVLAGSNLEEMKTTIFNSVMVLTYLRKTYIQKRVEIPSGVGPSDDDEKRYEDLCKLFIGEDEKGPYPTAAQRFASAFGYAFPSFPNDRANPLFPRELSTACSEARTALVGQTYDEIIPAAARCALAASELNVALVPWRRDNIARNKVRFKADYDKVERKIQWALDQGVSPSHPAVIKARKAFCDLYNVSSSADSGSAARGAVDGLESAVLRCPTANARVRAGIAIERLKDITSVDTSRSSKAAAVTRPYQHPAATLIRELESALATPGTSDADIAKKVDAAIELRREYAYDCVYY